MREFLSISRKFRIVKLLFGVLGVVFLLTPVVYAEDFNPYTDSTASVKNQLEDLHSDYSSIIKDYDAFKNQSMNSVSVTSNIFNLHEIGFWLLLFLLLLFLFFLISLRKNILQIYSKKTSGKEKIAPLEPEEQAPAPVKKIAAVEKHPKKTLQRPIPEPEANLVIPPQVVKIKVRKIKKLKNQ